MNTIVALATPPGKGAIHIIRISGPKTYQIINLLSKNPVNQTSDRVEVNYIISQKTNIVIDQVILLKFHNPHSYTGEDMVEINCHGSNFIVSLIIQEIISLGAVLAKSGEFTKRALLNNKMTLDQVENIQNLFSAKSSSEICSLVKNISTEHSCILQELESKLFQLIGEIELAIDYPPEISSMESTEQQCMQSRIKKIVIALEDLCKNSRPHKPSAFRVLLCGKPNAGKSSLINFLLDKEKIIVSNIPGTTRDSIEIEYFYKDYLLTLVDSAGIRETQDNLEKISIQKTKNEIEQANLIFLLIASDEIDDLGNQQLTKDLQDKNPIIIYTKGDLVEDINIRPMISVKNKDISFFHQLLDENLKEEYFPTGFKSEYMISKLFNSIDELRQSLRSDITIDLISEKLKISRDYLLDCLSITENNYEFIEKIFDNFCVGK